MRTGRWGWVLMVGMVALGNVAAGTQDQMQGSQPSPSMTAPTPSQPPIAPQTTVPPWTPPTAGPVPGVGYPGPTPAFNPQAFSLPQVEIPVPEAPVFGFATGPVIRKSADASGRSLLVVKDEPTGDEVTVVVDAQKTQMTRQGKPAVVGDYVAGDLADVTYQWIMTEGQEDQFVAVFVDTLEPGSSGALPEETPGAEP